MMESIIVSRIPSYQYSPTKVTAQPSYQSSYPINNNHPPPNTCEIPREFNFLNVSSPNTSFYQFEPNSLPLYNGINLLRDNYSHHSSVREGTSPWKVLTNGINTSNNMFWKRWHHCMKIWHEHVSVNYYKNMKKVLHEDATNKCCKTTFLDILILLGNSFLAWIVSGILEPTITQPWIYFWDP